MVEFEDLVHGSLQDDPEQIELLQEKLEVWLQVGKELEFEDPEDEITKCAKGLSWVASKLLKVAKCLPFDTCSPKDAWWAAREGRAVRRSPALKPHSFRSQPAHRGIVRQASSDGTKWGRVTTKAHMKFSILGLGETLSQELQKGYQVGGDFGGWKDKQKKWEEENQGMQGEGEL